jgi:hypothetical protein
MIRKEWVIWPDGNFDYTGRIKIDLPWHLRLSNPKRARIFADHLALTKYLALHDGYLPGTDDVLLYEVERVYVTRIDASTARLTAA